jgi:hypothetical protein
MARLCQQRGVRQERHKGYTGLPDRFLHVLSLNFF